MSEPTRVRVCVWTEDSEGDGDVYRSGCGHIFQFNTEGPKANNFKFCCYCGLRLLEKTVKLA